MHSGTGHAGRMLRPPLAVPLAPLVLTSCLLLLPPSAQWSSRSAAVSSSPLPVMPLSFVMRDALGQFNVLVAR